MGRVGPTSPFRYLDKHRFAEATFAGGGAMLARAVVFLCLLSAPSAVAAGDNDPAVGSPTLKGNLLVQWSDEKRFIYVTDSKNPLRFQTRDGREIKPGRMYTDGGSIPRVFWAFPGFSPWGYAPAYVLHDWLFHQHRCRRDDPPNRYTLAEANQVLDDTIGILFKLNTVEPNETARALIKWAVDNFAQRAWDESCDQEPPAPDDRLAALPFVVTVERLSFGN